MKKNKFYWIFNLSTHERKYIKASELNTFLNNGWINRKLSVHKGKVVSTSGYKKKLDAKKIKEIKRLMSQGVQQIKIAKQFNISASTISQIKTGKRYLFI